MEQIAEAICTFGREFFGADRRRDHRLDQTVVSMVLSEPSEKCEASDESKTSYRKRCSTADHLSYIQLAISYVFHNICIHV